MTPGTLPGSGDGVARTSGDADQPGGIRTGAAPGVEHADGRRDREPRTRLGRWGRRCTVDTGEEVELASRTHRWLSRVIDFMVFTVVIEFLETLVSLSGLYWKFWAPSPYYPTIGINAIIVIIVISLVILYEIVWVARQGHNFGKLVLGIRVVRLEDARTPGWWQCLARPCIPGVWAIWLFVGLWGIWPGVSTFHWPIVSTFQSWALAPGVRPIVFLLWFAPIMWQSRRQGLYDKFTATIVVTTGARSGTQTALAGFLLSIANLVNLRFTFSPPFGGRRIWTREMFDAASGFAAALVYGLSCWIGAIVFSWIALRHARHAHWTLWAFALAALGTTLTTVVLFALEWQMVFSA